MSPSIPSGSEVTVVPCVLSDVRPGWAVMVRGPSGILVHRAIAATDGRLMLWGDAMPSPDGPLDTFEVIGRVIAVRAPTFASRFGRRMRALVDRVSGLARRHP